MEYGKSTAPRTWNLRISIVICHIRLTLVRASERFRLTNVIAELVTEELDLTGSRKGVSQRRPARGGRGGRLGKTGNSVRADILMLLVFVLYTSGLF